MLECKNGTFDLYGRRYRIERAEVGFTGPVDDPELTLRVSRRLPEALLVITIDGTAQHLGLALTSEPPINDLTQLVSFVLEGRARPETRLSLHALDRRIAGTFSAAITRRIKEQIPRRCRWTSTPISDAPAAR